MTISEINVVIANTSWNFERFKVFSQVKYNHDVLISPNYPGVRVVAQNRSRSKWKVVMMQAGAGVRPMLYDARLADALTFVQRGFRA